MGLVSANGVDPVPIYVGSTIANESIELSAVTLGTNEFEGWYSDSELTNKIAFPYTITNNVTLYPNFTEDDKTITITINGNYGYVYTAD